MRKDFDVTAGFIALSLGVMLAAVCSYSGDSEVVKIENTDSPELKNEIVEVIDVKPVEIEEKQPDKIALGEFTITAYCPCELCCGAWADGIVYTGGYATENQTIAVDPAVIPLGSAVEINGKQYIAEDIGGAIEGKKIDLFKMTHAEALEYGVQSHEVYLIKEG